VAWDPCGVPIALCINGPDAPVVPYSSQKLLNMFVAGNCRLSPCGSGFLAVAAGFSRCCRSVSVCAYFTLAYMITLGRDALQPSPAPR